MLERLNRFCGYAYARPWHERRAYQHTVEVAIYLTQDNHGKGLGKHLYQALLFALPENIHSAIAVIALPNEKSVKLQERLGFKKVGQLHQVGYKFEQWIDVEHWQKML